MTWDEVHVEADVLEHAVSDRLEERIDAVLGHPTHDPHGDPIPPRDGRAREEWGTPLAAAADRARFRVERVSDWDSASLRYLAARGVPGALLEVRSRRRSAARCGSASTAGGTRSGRRSPGPSTDGRAVSDCRTPRAPRSPARFLAGGAALGAVRRRRSAPAR